MGSYLQERGPFLLGEDYSLDRCPSMGALQWVQVFTYADGAQRAITISNEVKALDWQKAAAGMS